jgi:hypothetical protein
MRITKLLLLMLATLVPAVAQAQAYRASVLWAPPDSALGGASGPDSAAAGPPPTPDSTAMPTFHAPSSEPFDPKRGESPLATPVVGGIVGGAAFSAAGILIGNAVDPEPSGEFIPTGIVLGYFIGETIGVPIGAHLGNSRRGNFAGDLGISILGHIAALGLATIGGGAGYIAGLSVQILATAVNEQLTGRKRALARHQREQAAEAAKSP